MKSSSVARLKRLLPVTSEESDMSRLLLPTVRKYLAPPLSDHFPSAKNLPNRSLVSRLCNCDLPKPGSAPAEIA